RKDAKSNDLWCRVFCQPVTEFGKVARSSTSPSTPNRWFDFIDSRIRKKAGSAGDPHSCECGYDRLGGIVHGDSAKSPKSLLQRCLRQILAKQGRGGIILVSV